MSIVEGLITQLLARRIIDLDDINDIAAYLEEHGEDDDAHIVRCLAVELAAKERPRPRVKLQLLKTEPKV